MRILCCLNRDLASSVALNILLPTFAKHTVCVGLTEQVGVARHLPEEPQERRELRIAEQSFPNEILFPLIERACLPDDGIRYLTFAEIERLRQIPVISLPNPNTPNALETIRHFAPDLIITIRYGAILKPSVITMPRFGVLNLHSGTLPAYRGVLATFRALMNGDTEISGTLHRISDGTIDTGEIVDVTRISVVPRRSLLWHILSLYPTSVAMIADAITRLDAGKSLVTRAQSASGGAYYSYPTAAEWAAFTQRGWSVTQLSELEEVFRQYSRV